MEEINNFENQIKYTEFIEYLDSGEWSLKIGIKDRMTVEEHLSYIERIVSFNDYYIAFVPNDNNKDLVDVIDVYIKPNICESEQSTKSKHIQFIKNKKQTL